MRIHSTSFLLKIVLVYDSGQIKTIDYKGNMPENVIIPIEATHSNPAALHSVQLNNIYINNNKLNQVIRFHPNDKQFAEQTLRYEQNGNLIFDLFNVDPIVYLLTIENEIN